MIDPNQALFQFIGSLPTLIAVILTWLDSNSRRSQLKQDLQLQIQDLRFQICATILGLQMEPGEKFEARSQKIDLDAALFSTNVDHMRETLLADFRRVEKSWTARIKHLEEREH